MMLGFYMHRIVRIGWFLPFVMLLSGCGGIPPQYASTVALPAPNGSGTPGTLPPINLPPDDARRTVLQWAAQQVGKPYTQWPANPALSCGRGGGGCTRNGPDCWDCSGFTHGAYATIGVDIGPTTFYQIDAGIAVTGGMDAWQPGDLLLYCDTSGPYHVAMYYGGGQMIQAANCDAGTLINPVYTTDLCAVRRIIPGGHA